MERRAPRDREARSSRIAARILLLGVSAMLGTGNAPARATELPDTATTEPVAVSSDPEAGSPAASAQAFRFGGAEADKAGDLPEFMRALFFKATVAFGKGDWKTAQEAYLQILEKHPDNALVLTNLATVEHRNGDAAAALTHLDRAVRINPAIPQAWILKGLIHFETDNPTLAVSALTRALHEDPQDPRTHNYLGVVLRDLGWLSGAEKELRRATELDPSYADAHFNLALLFLDKVPPAREMARRHYAKALELGSRPDKLAERRIKGDES
jgi:Flp pilus assembly protein TadD